MASLVGEALQAEGALGEEEVHLEVRMGEEELDLEGEAMEEDEVLHLVALLQASTTMALLLHRLIHSPIPRRLEENEARSFTCETWVFALHSRMIRC